jgi:hypothetical protein
MINVNEKKVICLRPALESYFGLKFFDVVTDTDWAWRLPKKG